MESVYNNRFERTKGFWDSRCSGAEAALDRSASWPDSLIDKRYPAVHRSTSWTHCLIEEGYPACLRYSWTDASDQLPGPLPEDEHAPIGYSSRPEPCPPCQVSDRLIDAAYSSYFNDVTSAVPDRSTSAFPDDSTGAVPDDSTSDIPDDSTRAVPDDPTYRLGKIVSRTMETVRLLQALNYTRLDHEERMMDELSSLASTIEALEADVRMPAENGARPKLPGAKRPWYPPGDEDDSSGAENIPNNLGIGSTSRPSSRPNEALWTSNRFEPTAGTSGIPHQTASTPRQLSTTSCTIEELDNSIESTEELLDTTAGTLGIMQPMYRSTVGSKVIPLITLNPLDQILGPHIPSTKPGTNGPVDGLYGTVGSQVKVLNTTASVGKLPGSTGPSPTQFCTLEPIDEQSDPSESSNIALCSSDQIDGFSGLPDRQLGTLESLDEVEFNLDPPVKEHPTTSEPIDELPGILPAMWTSAAPPTSKLGKGLPHQIKRSKPRSLAVRLEKVVFSMFMLMFFMALLAYVAQMVCQWFVTDSNEGNAANCEIWTGNHVKWDDYGLNSCFTRRVKYREGPA